VSALIGFRRVVNELIVGFLGTLPLTRRPKSRPITPWYATTCWWALSA
jgi:hypothetical protein